VQLGDDVEVMPHVVCYSGTIVGSRVILHAGVRLGADGFGYIPGKNGAAPRKIPQVGRCIIGDDVEIGANTTIDRGSGDDTVIGDIAAGATVSGYPARAHREFLRAQGALYRLALIVDDLEALVRRADDAER